MTNYISLETSEDVVRRQNFFYISAVFGFVWIIFHFIAIFFFGMILKSVMLVGIFLGIGNFIGLLLDIPIGVLLKYFKPKVLLIFGQFLMLLAALIYLKFIYAVSLMEINTEGDGIIIKSINTVVGIFVNSGLNIFLLLIAAVFYGISRELIDVTNLSYIMNNSDPSEYAEIMSKNNLFTGGGSLIGLLVSGVILALNPGIAIIFLITVIFILIGFTSIFYNNGSKTINFGEIKDLKVTLEKGQLNTIKNYAFEKIKKTDLLKIAKSTKIIFLKPIAEKKNIDTKEIFETTKKDFANTNNVLFLYPINKALIWCLIVLSFFGFWDTFVATFQVEFLNKLLYDASENGDIVLKNTYNLITGYVLLGIIVIPAFVSQIFFIRLAGKIGISKVMSLGLLLSGLSIIAIGLTNNIWLVVFFGVINSLGYAAVMPLGQEQFCNIFNKDYSKKLNLQEIDSNASAAPLKIVSNSINIFGLVFGGIIVSILGFNGFFIFFGSCIIILLGYTIFIMQQLDF